MKKPHVYADLDFLRKPIPQKEERKEAMSIYNPTNRYATVGAYYALRLNKFDMPIHTHNRCEIMYLVDGNCIITVNGEVMRLKSSQFVFIDQNVPHRLYIQEGTPCTILNLEFSCKPDADGVDLALLEKECVTYHTFLRKKASYARLQDHHNVGYALKDLITELEKRNDDGYLVSVNQNGTSPKD